MLALAPGAMPIYFYIGPTDMRKGFDGLMRLAEQQAARSGRRCVRAAALGRSGPLLRERHAFNRQ